MPYGHGNGLWSAYLVPMQEMGILALASPREGVPRYQLGKLRQKKV
jgi:hypothetical protein